jgi:chemotaxis signal transduction protein
VADSIADVTAGQHNRMPVNPTDSLSSMGSQLAQGIVCGDLRLAFGFDWARQIVDNYELVSMPRAPGWILGAVNINGAIVPVIDLANYFYETAQPAQTERGQRLLVGGIVAEDSESAFAVVFNQTPVQLEYSTQPIDQQQHLPGRLLEVCRGVAKDPSGTQYFEIDPERLIDALSIELSVI